MVNISVSYDEMRSAAARLLTQKTAIEAELDKTQSFVQQLTGGGFVTDAASGRFNDAAQAFVASAKNLAQSLQDMSSYLDGAANALGEVDRQLATKITN